jgi:hypothetical protein
MLCIGNEGSIWKRMESRSEGSQEFGQVVGEESARDWI